MVSLDLERLLKRVFCRIGTTVYEDISYLTSIFIINDCILTLHQGPQTESEEA